MIKSMQRLSPKLDSIKQALIDAKCLVWDHITKEIKKMKDDLVMLQYEKALVDTCLTNVALVQEGMGHKHVQAKNAINFLNSQSKFEL